MSRPTMQVASGRFVNLAGPDPSDIEITDIAHHLSHLCRFTGACREFYSVAQHSVLVSRNVPPEFALEGLLHDGVEAYLNDNGSPQKELNPSLRKNEQRMWVPIAQRFGLAMRLPDCVKMADRIVLVTERRDLMPKPKGAVGGWEGYEQYRPLPEKIVPEDSRTARTRFLLRFRYLMRQRTKAETRILDLI